MVQPKILIWDIESTGLNATFGTILCIGYKWYDEDDVHVFTILDKKRGKKDMLNDKHLVEEFVKVYEQADYHISWYGDRFDVPMLKSRMIKHGLPPLAPIYSLDLWKQVRYTFKLHSNRLVTWQQFLQVEDEKSQIDFDAWLRAAQGDKDSLAEVVDHCRRDVLVLEEVFTKLRPWLDKEPSVNLFGGLGMCPSCDGSNVQRRGYKVATTRTYQQYRCMDCGRWFRDTKALTITRTRNTS